MSARIHSGLFCLLLAMLVALPFQGSRSLYETTEGRYAESAREMVESGDWLQPQLDYQPHWTKPPITYWFLASGLAIFGRNAWGARLPGALAFVLTTWLVFQIGLLLWGRREGFIAALVFATSALGVYGAYAVSTDIFLTLFETAGVYGFLRACRADPSPTRERSIVLMTGAFGLAFLTKGPPALLPLLPILWWNYRRPAPVALFRPLPVAVFTVTALSWYLAVIINHPELLSYFVGTEIIGRIASDDVHNPHWYSVFTLYLPMLLGALGLWGPLAGYLWFKQRRAESMRGTVTSTLTDASHFLRLWLLLPLMVFCLAKSKLPLYLLPLGVPLSLLAVKPLALGLDDRALTGVGVFVLVFTVTAKGIIAYLPNWRDASALAAQINGVETAMAERFEVAVFKEAQMFGLQFYRGGKLLRVENPRGQWNNYAIDDLLAEIAAGTRQPRILLVCLNSKCPVLETLLTNYNLSFTKHQGPYWTLYLPSSRLLSPQPAVP